MRFRLIADTEYIGDCEKTRANLLDRKNTDTKIQILTACRPIETD